MSDAVKIKVTPRDSAKNKGTGTRVARRLRKQGLVPAVIYGHKQAVVPVTLTSEDVRRMIKMTGHLAELDLGGTTETVLIRDVQWDHLGKEILHLDFARVNAEETIETEVPIELRGTSVGVADGGILEHLVHSLRVACRAGSIPDAIKLDITNLQSGHGIHVREMTLPEGVVAKAEPDLLVVHVVVPAGDAAADAAAEAGTQPEVIKPERKEKEKE
jgi:large subunit ribosomal protein L25